METPAVRPQRLLTQNSELRKVGVWNWTLPAHTLKLTDGSWFNTCPNAGSCGRVCYAKMGTYTFSNVRKRHLQNLEYVLQDGDAWEAQMTAEVAHKRMRPTGIPLNLDHDPTDKVLSDWITRGGKAVRIHDAGDFFSADYLNRWSRIAVSAPDVLFYAYTKEVWLLKEKKSKMPPNLRVVYSYGGKQDHLIDRDTDRHADVFPTATALADAGYYDQEDNDLLAVTAPTTKIGIVANNLPVANKRFAGKTMSELSAT
jgi:hypothetical protein